VFKEVIKRLLQNNYIKQINKFVFNRFNVIHLYIKYNTGFCLIAFYFV